MPASIKTAALAFIGMAGLGVGAPLAAYYANNHTLEPALVLPHRTPPPPDLQQKLIAAPIQIAPEVVTPREVNRVARRLKTAAIRRGPAAEPERTCGWHQTEALAPGEVWVCDTPRTSNERPKGTFHIEAKSQQLAPRDVPSPSGFVD